MPKLNPITRGLIGFAAGAIVVVLIDRLLWPGTLVHGLIGVAVAAAVTASMSRRRG